MKPLILIISLLFAVNSMSYAQGSVADTHPNSSIFAIDYSSGQATLATSDAAILFKDALIELVSNTNVSRGQLMRAIPGSKAFIITQMDPQTSGNAWQVVLQNKSLNQTVYTFLYNADQNTLSFFNPQSQNYSPVGIQGNNLNNLNNCVAYGKFNGPNAQPAQETAAVDADASTPVDADVTATTVPPALPDYEQPECPTEGFLWQPGFWSFSLANGGYYWVPGAWVAPPSVGVLWTPPYWGFEGGVYAFHGGYWGTAIGFYGGINYGFGYAGEGFVGGDWRDGHFRYNTAVMRVNERFHYKYEDRAVIFRGKRSRLAFNGRGGIDRRPNERERLAANEHHIMATREQIRNQQIARADKSQFASHNGGKPGNFARANVPAKGPGVNTSQRPGVRPATNGGQRIAGSPSGARLGGSPTSGLRTTPPGPGGAKTGVAGVNKTTSKLPGQMAKPKTPLPKPKLPVKKA
jgi:hypothetical protein